MKVFFRVDASRSIGVGHLMRCKILAMALLEVGDEVTFICREHKGNLINILREEGYSVLALPETSEKLDQLQDYESWLGETQLMDARQTLSVLDGSCPDLMIVDHYGIDSVWESAVRAFVNRLVVIDDLANRRHVCDLLLNQNFYLSQNDKYKSLLPGSSKVLLGPKYALINREYAKMRDCMRVRDGNVRRINLYFGGSDLAGMTDLALAALSATMFKDIAVDVVVGHNNSHRSILTDMVLKRENTKLYEPQNSLVQLICEADLAVGAGGSTTWERMCLGVPSFLVSIADNQESICRDLADAGYVRYLGRSDELTSKKFLEAIDDAVSDGEWLRRVSRKQMELVDGYGAERVVSKVKKLIEV